MTSEPIIRVERLWTRFGTTVIHKNISLDVCRGEVLCIIGGSGSGKTTLMRQMMGLERPWKGSVRVFGQPLAELSEDAGQQLRERIGVLFQMGALFSALTVYENVALPLRELRILPEPAVRDLAMLKLSQVGISARDADKLPAELSGGMVKRVGLARALALEPELLFLDEPTAGLDPDRSEAIVKLIQRLREDLSLTVVMVTHDLDTLLDIADRVAVLCTQRLVAVGPLAHIVHVDHPFIHNLFDGERGQRVMQALGLARSVV